MPETYVRVETLLGREKSKLLSRARIAIFGVGSVGSYAADALMRCGVASLTLVDPGQLSGRDSAVFAAGGPRGQSAGKVSLMKEYIHAFDEGILVHTYESAFCQETMGMFGLREFDYIIDAMGDVQAKLLLCREAASAGVPLISCMDVHNKLDPGRLEVADIYRTSVCPMAREMRAGLRRLGVRRQKVLYSRESFYMEGIRYRKAPDEARSPYLFRKKDTNASGRSTQGRSAGTAGFMAMAAGGRLAAEVLKELLSEKKKRTLRG